MCAGRLRVMFPLSQVEVTEADEKNVLRFATPPVPELDTPVMRRYSLA